MNKSLIVILLSTVALSCIRNNTEKKNCFNYNIKAELNLGYYSMSFDSLKIDSALYYNNKAIEYCSDSKKILETRLNIFALKQKYINSIETINKLIKLDSVDHSEKLNLSFKKAVYYACIDSVKYRDSVKREYTYLLDQPKEWNDSLLYQYRLGILEYQLFGKDRALIRLNKIKDYNLFMKGTIINLGKGSITPLHVLVDAADIYHPLNDNREKAHIGN